MCDYHSITSNDIYVSLFLTSAICNQYLLITWNYHWFHFMNKCPASAIGHILNYKMARQKPYAFKSVRVGLENHMTSLTINSGDPVWMKMLHFSFSQLILSVFHQDRCPHFLFWLQLMPVTSAACTSNRHSWVGVCAWYKQEVHIVQRWRRVR